MRKKLLLGSPHKKKPGPEALRFWLELFWIFFKIGALTLGGGYAMIPLIYQEVVECRQWLEKKTFFSGLVIAQAIPGANAVNIASFVGYRRGGLFGAVVAVVACVLPSFLIICALGSAFVKFASHPSVSGAFEGLRAGIIGLLVYVLGDWGRQLLGKPKGLLVFCLTLFGILVLKWHPILVIVLGGILGFLLSPLPEEDQEEEDLV
ncbi:MAG: Chromate transport protein [Thermoanaerobacterales bacterium 50_218]|nr:MAG: Chromate transport protein [Thermoanaerobacterales bacterium 50_218]